MEVQTNPTLANPSYAVDLRGEYARRRIIGTIVALGAGGILGIAAWLTPAEEGLGTHTQLSMPQCGWITLMDLPCPTCGMTTSFTHAADGNLLQSFLTQPLGSLLAVATAMALMVGMYVVLTGSRIGNLFARLWGRRSGWIIAVLIVTSWLYKILTHRGMI